MNKLFESVDALFESGKSLIEEEREYSSAEKKLLDIISISRHFDNLDGVQLTTTDKGNYWVTVDGKDLLTISGDQFSEDEVEDLRLNGYWRDLYDESEERETYGLDDVDYEGLELVLDDLSTTVNFETDSFSTIEDEVHNSVWKFNDANGDPEYADEDFGGHWYDANNIYKAILKMYNRTPNFETKVNEDIEAAKRDLAIEPGSDEESTLNSLYDRTIKGYKCEDCGHIISSIHDWDKKSYPREGVVYFCPECGQPYESKELYRLELTESTLVEKLNLDSYGKAAKRALKNLTLDNDEQFREFVNEIVDEIIEERNQEESETLIEDDHTVEELLDIKETLAADETDRLMLFTRNKETGEQGCANFFTNGEDKVRVYEGNGDGSDDKDLTYEEFIAGYDFALADEDVTPDFSGHTNESAKLTEQDLTDDYFQDFAPIIGKRLIIAKDSNELRDIADTIKGVVDYCIHQTSAKWAEDNNEPDAVIESETLTEADKYGKIFLAEIGYDGVVGTCRGIGHTPEEAKANVLKLFMQDYSRVAEDLMDRYSYDDSDEEEHDIDYTNSSVEQAIEDYYGINVFDMSSGASNEGGSTLSESASGKKVLKESTDSEVEAMMRIERWLVRMDITDDYDHSLSWYKEQSFRGYVSENRSFLQWKAPDLIPDFDELVSSLKKEHNID